MKRKLLSLALALVLALGLCPGKASAAGAEQTPALETSLVSNGVYCVLKSNGELWKYDESTSERIATDIVAISGEGLPHCVMALKSDGNLWYYNYFAGKSSASIMASNVRSLWNDCYLTADGTLYYHYYWMDEEQGYALMPHTDKIAENVISFASDKEYITSDHVLHYRYYNVSSDNSAHRQYTETQRTAPGFSAITGQYVSGYSYFGKTFYAISDDGALYSWGDNCYGQTGCGNICDSYYTTVFYEDVALIQTPTKVLDHVSSLSNVLTVPCDTISYPGNPKYCVYVRDDNGTLWQWGDALTASTLAGSSNPKILSETEARSCTPRKCADAKPQIKYFFEFNISSDGTVGIFSSDTKLPVKFSELMGYKEFFGGVTVQKPSAPSKPAGITATPTSSTVLVNGTQVAFDAYNIGGNNYFKLRDLAYALNGSEKQFEVSWDGEANAISLTSGQSYTAVGGEMTGKGSGNQTANPTDSKLLLDGEALSLTAYNIGGNNYFKLRDIGQTFDFGVGWDDATRTITIDTTTGYTAE